VSKDYEIGREREKLKKTKKEDLDWSIGKWTYYQRRENMTGGPRYMLGGLSESRYTNPNPGLRMKK